MLRDVHSSYSISKTLVLVISSISKNVYYSLKSIGPVYSWYASKNIATILLEEKGKKYSIKSLEDQFNLLSNPNFEHYYELANFYKDNE